MGGGGLVGVNADLVAGGRLPCHFGEAAVADLLGVLQGYAHGVVAGYARGLGW